ncbi:MAG: type III pantothenate kinase [Oscillospiraceae bacterium]
MIDMGTATTISYISSRRSYEGGLMFPGVRLSLDALSDHTAQLPDISLQHPKEPHRQKHRGLHALRHCLTAPPGCWTASSTASGRFCPRGRPPPSWPPAATPR